MSDEGGGVVESYGYSPYGEYVSAGTDVDNPFTLAGRFGVMREGMSGLYLMRQRYYDSRVKRFISPAQTSPHIHPLTIVPYSYAAADPVNHFDPVGSGPVETTLEAMSTAGTLAGTAAFELGQRADQAKATADWLEGWTNQFAELAKDRNGNVFPNERLSTSFKLAKKSEEAAVQAGRLNRIAKPLNAVGHVGTAAQVVDIGLEMNKFKNTLNKALEDYDVRARMAGDVFAEKAATAFAIFRKKGRSLGWLESKLNLFRSEMEWELFMAGYSYDLDFLTGIWTAWGNSIGSFVPGFTGFDLDKEQTIEFFGQ